jgi:cell division protein FtsQ
VTAAHVRRGAPSRRGKPKASAKVAVPKKIAKRLPVSQARANRIAGLVFAAFLFAIGLIVLIALDIPAKAERAMGVAIGKAGFRVSGYQISGLHHMARASIDDAVNDELSRAAEASGSSSPSQALVDVGAIRRRLLRFGWIKDARVLRRLPDTLVIDIVERVPAALWQNQGRLALIDSEGVVLDRVPVDRMPDLPLLIGPGANAHSAELQRLMEPVPTLEPQLTSATWVGERRWDLNFQSGETLALPEGEKVAGKALRKFAQLDKTTGLLGRGVLRYDLRIPDKMIARLPRAPGEPIAGAATPVAQIAAPLPPPSEPANSAASKTEKE